LPAPLASAMNWQDAQARRRLSKIMFRLRWEASTNISIDDGRRVRGYIKRQH
jgi:hypothetical protein